MVPLLLPTVLPSLATVLPNLATVLPSLATVLPNLATVLPNLATVLLRLPMVATHQLLLLLLSQLLPHKAREAGSSTPAVAETTGVTAKTPHGLILPHGQWRTAAASHTT